VHVATDGLISFLANESPSSFGVVRNGDLYHLLSVSPSVVTRWIGSIRMNIHDYANLLGSVDFLPLAAVFLYARRHALLPPYDRN